MVIDTADQAQTSTDKTHRSISSIRIAIVEDMKCVAQLLHHFCQRQLGLEVVSVAYDGAQGLAAIVRLLPDIVLLDLGLPDVDGVTLAGRINEAAPLTRIIVVSGSCGDYQLHRLGEVEIHGFVDKSSDDVLTNLPQAIDIVHRGGTFYSPRYLNAFRKLRYSETAFFKLLSTREQETLVWISQSYSDEEIAQQLGVSSATARTHRHNIMQKLNIRSTPKLIRYGLNLGMGAMEPARLTCSMN